MFTHAATAGRSNGRSWPWSASASPQNSRLSCPCPFPWPGAVRYPKQAQFHPLKFLYALAKDLHIYEHTAVRELVGTTAITGRGKITAKKIIVATHFPFLNKHGSYFIKLYQHRSYVIALEHAADVDGMYVDEARKGLSFRNYKNLLLIGGGGHRTGKKVETGRNCGTLRGGAIPGRRSGTTGPRRTA